jgi:transposase, IS5 family
MLRDRYDPMDLFALVPTLSLAVETTIHHPTDSGLLGDGVRMLSRLLRGAKAAVGQAARPGPQAFRSRVRSVRRLLRQLRRFSAQGRGGHGAVAVGV